MLDHHFAFLYHVVCRVNSYYFGVFQILISYGADITMQDKRRRNVLHFLADAYCIDGCDAVLEQANRRSAVHLIINQQELYLGAEQCFLVRGKLEKHL